MVWRSSGGNSSRWRCKKARLPWMVVSGARSSCEASATKRRWVCVALSNEASISLNVSTTCASSSRPPGWGTRWLRLPRRVPRAVEAAMERAVITSSERGRSTRVAMSQLASKVPASVATPDSRRSARSISMVASTSESDLATSSTPMTGPLPAGTPSVFPLTPCAGARIGSASTRTCCPSTTVSYSTEGWPASDALAVSLLRGIRVPLVER